MRRLNVPLSQTLRAVLSLALRADDRDMRLNPLLLRSTLVGALGGLLFGFDTAVIAGTTHQLTEVFHLSAGALGLTVSIALWGTRRCASWRCSIWFRQRGARWHGTGLLCSAFG